MVWQVLITLVISSGVCGFCMAWLLVAWRPQKEVVREVHFYPRQRSIEELEMKNARYALPEQPFQNQGNKQPRTSEQRRAQSERMMRRWAEKRARESAPAPKEETPKPSQETHDAS